MTVDTKYEVVASTVVVVVVIVVGIGSGIAIDVVVDVIAIEQGTFISPENVQR